MTKLGHVEIKWLGEYQASGKKRVAFRHSGRKLRDIV